MKIDIKSNPYLERMASEEPLLWVNPKLNAGCECELVSIAGIDDAEARLLRFAPLIAKLFPETAEAGGLIESPLVEIPQMKHVMEENLGVEIKGQVFLKLDSDLPIAGSVKARGGIYEILCLAEEIALEAGILTIADDYTRLANDDARQLFSKHKVHVGSTGNLGLSIGIISAKLGFTVTVHMSADAKAWKKALLRENGVTVKEYDAEYSVAVVNGRNAAASDPHGYFVDDENSYKLFYGYAVAARRLKEQFDQQGIIIEETRPLFVYIPCGVGGAPAGIAYGLKTVFGEHVHVFFSEPTTAPCMLVGLITGEHHNVSVHDIGLSGKTAADGLAVSRVSLIAGKVMEHMLSGEATLPDADLNPYLRMLYQSENRLIEPSACAGFAPLRELFASNEGKSYINSPTLSPNIDNAVHIVWATGGRLVPREEYEQMLR